MRILGVDFQGSKMIFVALSGEGGEQVIGTNGTILLGSEREPQDLRSFQTTVATVLNEAKPDVIAIKKKPHKGGMPAGPAAIKMEALVLFSSRCSVKFYTPQRLKKVALFDNDLFDYQHDALRAAMLVK